MEFNSGFKGLNAGKTSSSSTTILGPTSKTLTLDMMNIRGFEIHLSATTGV